MGQRPAIANAGRAKAFAFLKRIQRLAGVQPVKLRRRFPEVLFGEIEGIGEPAARFLDTGLVARFG